MKNILLHSALLSAAILGGCAQTDNTDTDTSQTLTALWDKTFELDPAIHHEKITFKNRYGITIAADLYKRDDAKRPYRALAISGPFGAVKEQASGLYAQEMAKRGYLAIAFDPSFTGESSGFPRNVASPDINTEDFQAAVDYLSTNKDVDKDKIGIIGICGFGGFSISAAINDSRIKAVTAVTMYDMSRVTANGYFDKENT
ncbi:MAG: CocE/NonD family hydrolase, partial [Succinivibrio sp.]